jgi:secondary thiamine-phosphate synthase enzyme
VETQRFEIETGRRRVSDITAQVLEFCTGSAGGSDGLCSVFVPHATAGVALMEVGSGSDEDLARALERLLPRDESYSHRHGSRGHGADHLLPVLVSPSIVIPVIGGAPALGTWQSVVLVDLNADNPRRQVLLSFLAG